LEQKNKELHNKTEALAELIKLRTIVSNCKAEIETIVSRLDQFVVVWSMVCKNLSLGTDYMTHHLCQISEDALNIMKSLKDVDDVYSDEVSFYLLPGEEKWPLI
jgi:hypothetical protein